MVYGVLQLINFAHSEVYMMGAFAAYYSASALNLEARPGVLSLMILLFVAIFFCSCLGVLIEFLAYRPLRKAPKINVLITAIGVSLFLQYSAQVFFGADPKVFPQVLENTTLFTFFDVPIKSLDLSVFVVTLVSMILLYLFIFFTKYGKALRAVSCQIQVAPLMGISVNRMISLTFVLGSSLAGVGSVLVGLKYPKIEPLMGLLFGMKAFVAAVLGGIGNIPGAVIGGLLMGLSEEMVVAYLSSTYRDALAFGLLIFILIFKPTGILGKNSAEKV